MSEPSAATNVASPTEAVSAPAESSAPQESSVAVAESTAVSTEKTAEPAGPDWSRLESLDLEDIVAHSPKLARRLDGKVGEISARRAQQLAQQQLTQERQRWEQERKAAEEEAVRDKLADDDPYAYVQQEKQRKQQEQEDRQRQVAATKLEADIRSATYGELDLAMMTYYNELPPDIQAKIAGKRYDGERHVAYTAFLKEVNGLMNARAERLIQEKSQEAVEKAKLEWVKTEKPRLVNAARKDALSDAVATEGTPDVSEGSGANGHITQEVFDQNRHNGRWVRENLEQISQAVSERRIRR